MVPLAAKPPPPYWGEIDRVWGWVSLPLLAMLSAIAAVLVARAVLKRFHSEHVAAVQWSSLAWGLVATFPGGWISNYIAYWVGRYIIERTDLDLFAAPWNRDSAVRIATEILTALLLVPLFSALATAGLLALTHGLWSAVRRRPSRPNGLDSD